MLGVKDYMEINFSNYSLNELREAWLSIDDYTYPDRAVEIYLRLNKMESETVQENFLDSAPNWVIRLMRFFYRPPSFHETTFDDVLLEESNAKMKEKRVKKLIEARNLNGNL